MPRSISHQFIKNILQGFADGSGIEEQPTSQAKFLAIFRKKSVLVVFFYFSRSYLGQSTVSFSDFHFSMFGAKVEKLNLCERLEFYNRHFHEKKLLYDIWPLNAYFDLSDNDQL